MQITRVGFFLFRSLSLLSNEPSLFLLNPAQPRFLSFLSFWPHVSFSNFRGLLFLLRCPMTKKIPNGGLKGGSSLFFSLVIGALGSNWRPSCTLTPPPSRPSIVYKGVGLHRWAVRLDSKRIPPRRLTAT